MMGLTHGVHGIGDTVGDQRACGRVGDRGCRRLRRPAGRSAAALATRLEHVLVSWPWDFSSPTCPSSTSPSGARAPAPRRSARWPGTGPRSASARPSSCTSSTSFKILLYILGGWLFALATEGIDGFTNVGQWWTEPIVFQKVVLYTMLFEVIGLGCGFGPLNNRFFPPLGSILYWLRPNTIRLPPWPDRVPLTKGTARTPIDVGAVCRPAGGARRRAVLRRHRTDAVARHHRRGAAAVADLGDPRACWRSRACATR